MREEDSSINLGVIHMHAHMHAPVLEYAYTYASKPHTCAYTGERN